VTTIVSYLDGTKGYDTLIFLRSVAQNCSSFHPSIVARVPPELVANVAVARVQEEQEFGIGNLTNSVWDLLTPLPRVLFGSVFEISGLTQIADCRCRNDGGNKQSWRIMYHCSPFSFVLYSYSCC
jgi:hypothetical protein